MSVTSVPMSAVSGHFTASVQADYDQVSTAERRARQQQLLKQKQAPATSAATDARMAAVAAAGAAAAAAGTKAPAAAAAARQGGDDDDVGRSDQGPVGVPEAAVSQPAAAAGTPSGLAPHHQQQQQQEAGTPAQQHTGAGTTGVPSAPLQIGGQQLYIDERRGILLQDTARQALLAQDGSAMHLVQHSGARRGNRHATTTPYVGLISEPHIVSGTGHPYHACHSGALYPLALSPWGKPYLGPDGKPLLLGPPWAAARGSAAAMARLGASWSTAATATGDDSISGSSSAGMTVSGLPALPADTVLVWPILTRSGKGAALLGPAGEALGFAAIPADFPYLSAVAAARVHCEAAKTGAAALAASSSPAGGQGGLSTAAPSAQAAAPGGASSVLQAATGPVLIALSSGQPLLAADGSRIQLSANGQGFVNSVSGKQLYGAHGQPLSLARHHRSRQERVASMLAVFQKAAQQGRLPQEAVHVAQTLMQRKHSHWLAEAALLGLVLVVAAAWLAALVLLPVCWVGLGGASGCGVSASCACSITYLLASCWTCGAYVNSCGMLQGLLHVSTGGRPQLKQACMSKLSAYICCPAMCRAVPCRDLQALKLGALLLPILLVAAVSMLLLLAAIYGQITTDEIVDAILPEPQKLRSPHPILVGLVGEPLQLADGSPLGVSPNTADGGKTLALVSNGRRVRGLQQQPLTFKLGGPKGRTLVDNSGSILLGCGGLPLVVRTAKKSLLCGLVDLWQVLRLGCRALFWVSGPDASKLAAAIGNPVLHN